MRIRIQILIGIQVISLRFTEFFKQKIIFKFFVLFFSPIFILKLVLLKKENFYNLFFQKFRFEIRSKKSFFLQILVDILPLGSGSRKPESYGSNGSVSLALVFNYVNNVAFIWDKNTWLFKAKMHFTGK